MQQYKVSYIIRDRVDSYEFVPAPLSGIQEMAKRTVDAGTADRVDVSDASGAVVFRWPRTVHG
jgi:hypothetical protein